MPPMLSLECCFTSQACFTVIRSLLQVFLIADPYYSFFRITVLVIRRDPNPYYRYSNTLLSASVIRKFVKTLNRFFSETGTHKLSKYKCVLYFNIELHPGRPTTPRTSPTTPVRTPTNLTWSFWSSNHCKCWSSNQSNYISQKLGPNMETCLDQMFCKT